MDVPRPIDLRPLALLALGGEVSGVKCSVGGRDEIRLGDARRRHDDVMKSRWFPGQRNADPRFESGWHLAETHWDAETFELGVELMRVCLDPGTRLLQLDFRIDGHDSRRIEFPEIADFQFDGSLDIGITDGGWEVLGTSMVVGAAELVDERRVYAL